MSARELRGADGSWKGVMTGSKQGRTPHLFSFIYKLLQRTATKIGK